MSSWGAIKKVSDQITVTAVYEESVNWILVNSGRDYEMKTLSALLSFWEHNLPFTSGSPSQVMQNFSVGQNMLLNIVDLSVIWDRMTLMWHHCNVLSVMCEFMGADLDENYSFIRLFLYIIVKFSVGLSSERKYTIYKTDAERRQTLGHPRSINPNMINHVPQQSPLIF